MTVCEADEFIADEIKIGDQINYEQLLPALKSLARDYMTRFFKDKHLWCGGPISDKKLLSDDNVMLVINADVEAACDIVYAAIGLDSNEDDNGLVGDDVKRLISVLNRCSKSGIPKEFAAGMSLLYLEFCEGVDFD